MLNDQIAIFWKWFTENRATIEMVVNDNHHLKLDEIVENLDQHILGMGKIKWQLDSPIDNQFSLTISPNNDRDLLKITKQIIQQAPRNQNWVFYHALQALNKYETSLYDSAMEICNISCIDWQVVREMEPDGRSFLVICADNMTHLDEDTELIAVDLILTSLLGEELKINTVAGFDVVLHWDPVQKDLAFPIQSLQYELIS